MIRVNYSEWQERKTTEDTRKKLKEIPLEKEVRLERKNLKSEKFRKYSEMENKEEMYKRRILLAEIKENAWKRRGSRSSHEEHSERLETEKKKEEMGKVRERIKKPEETKKTAESKETERRKVLLWRTERKRKGEKGNKQLFKKDGSKITKSVEHWEELVEETEHEKEDFDEWGHEEWTVEGFQEAGKLLEEVLTDVLAFEELREKLDGTVQTNNYKHQNLSNPGKSKLGMEEEQEVAKSSIQ